MSVCACMCIGIITTLSKLKNLWSVVVLNDCLIARGVDGGRWGCGRVVRTRCYWCRLQLIPTYTEDCGWGANGRWSLAKQLGIKACWSTMQWVHIKWRYITAIVMMGAYSLCPICIRLRITVRNCLIQFHSFGFFFNNWSHNQIQLSTFKRLNIKRFYHSHVYIELANICRHVCLSRLLTLPSLCLGLHTTLLARLGGSGVRFRSGQTNAQIVFLLQNCFPVVIVVLFYVSFINVAEEIFHAKRSSSSRVERDTFLCVSASRLACCWLWCCCCRSRKGRFWLSCSIFKLLLLGFFCTIFVHAQALNLNGFVPSGVWAS